MTEEALGNHIFVRLEQQVQDHVEIRNLQNSVQLLKVMSKFEGKYSFKTMRSSRNSYNAERRGWNSVGCLMQMTVEKIGGIRKFCVDRVMAKMIIGVITRMVVKEISCSTAGIDFRGMMEDLTIEDTNLEMGVKMTILVEGTTEIEVRVRILVEAIGGKGVD
ncbi:uncharacterized protein TNCV_3794261 [Trichonephila clavipes]|nr:uncharacterized protein TNCV_3794261 [Trichonephila clavipes]